jgi:WD40 repeat protein
MKNKFVYCSIVLFFFFNNDLFAGTESKKFADTLLHFTKLEAHKGGAFAVVYSPSGKWMASCGLDATVKIWNVHANRILKTLKGHVSEVTTVAISADGKYLASADYDKRIIIWETGTWKQFKVITLNSWSTALSFNQKGQLAIGLQNGEVRIIDVATGNPVLTFDTEFGVNCLSFSDDDKRIITGGPVIAWDGATGKKIKSFKVPGGVNGIAVAKGSSHFVSVHSRGVAYVSDLNTGDTIFTYTEKRKSFVPASTGGQEYMVKMPIIASSFSADGMMLALSCYNNKILILDHESHAVKYILQGYSSPVTSIAFAPDGKKLAGCTGDGKILIWDLK